LGAEKLPIATGGADSRSQSGDPNRM